MTVYAMPKEHLVGTDSTTPAYAWNSDGVLLGTQDEKSAGYDDLDYVKSIVNLLPQLGNIDTTHKTWAAAGFSQGGLMLNEVVSKIPGLFPTVDFVGTSMEKGYPYTVQPGNAMNVGVVQLLGDHETLPMPGNGNFKYKAEQDLRSVLDKFGDLGKAVLDRVDPLAPIQNDEQHQSPALLESFYVLQLARQGIDSEQTTSAGSQNQDVEKVYKPADANNHNQLTVFDVKNSDHNWPGPDPTGAKTNGNPKDTEFNTTLEMVNIWQQYNAKK
jgi:poly(3-hydroxybutyrate) depolymerase